MAGPFDFTGQNIENTYQRVLQTDGTNVYDGTGSLFTLPAAGVSQITAGNGIVLSPAGGTGIVEITALASSYNTATGSYGSFYDTGSQTAVSNLVIYSMSLSTTDISNGVYVSGSDRTRVYFSNAGIYNIQFSAQFRNSGNDPDDVSIWIRKNDSGPANDIPDSSGICTVPAKKGTEPGQLIASWNYLLSLAADDFIQLCWHPVTSNTITLETIPAATNPTHPRTPSLILTAQRVDTFLSNTGSFSGSFIGSFTGSFTGSLLGTASWADSASQALTASYYQETDPVFVAKSASLATTGSNTFIGNQIISGSITTTGSVGIGTPATSTEMLLVKGNSATTNNAFKVQNSTPTDIFTITNNGTSSFTAGNVLLNSTSTQLKLGIGRFDASTVTTPQYPIHVVTQGGTDATLVFDGKQYLNNGANANLNVVADTIDKVAQLNFVDRGTLTTTLAFSAASAGSAFLLLDRSGSAMTTPVGGIIYSGSAPLVTGGRRNDFYVVNGFADRSIIFMTSGSDGSSGANIPGKPRMTITGSNVGIGTITPTTTLHVRSGSSNANTSGVGNIATFESNTHAYVSIYSSQSQNSGVHFGSNADPLGAYLRWNNDNNLMTLGTANDGDDISFVTGNETSSMYLKNNVGLGIGTTAPIYKLHVRNGSVTNSSNFAGALAVIENSGSNSYLTMISHDAYVSGIGFGSNTHRSSANLAWSYSALNFNLTTRTSSAFLTFGTDVGTERMRITSGGLVGIGTTVPQHMLDVSGSARVTSSLYLPGLTTTAQNNVVTVDISTGQLYYTASSAFGGGSSTPTFPYTGSAIISGSLTITGSLLTTDNSGRQSIDTFNRYLYNSANNVVINFDTPSLDTPNGNTALDWSSDYIGISNVYHKQTSRIDVEGEALSNTLLEYSGQAFRYAGSVHGSCVTGNLIYLHTDGIWYAVNQTTDTSTKMLGIYLGSDYVLLEGDVTLDTIQAPNYGLPVYIKEGVTSGGMITSIPTSGYVRVIGHCYYRNSVSTSQWILKFKPANDWYKI